MQSLRFFLLLNPFYALLMAIHPQKSRFPLFRVILVVICVDREHSTLFFLSQHAFRCTRKSICRYDGQFRLVWDFLGSQKDGCWHRFGWCFCHPLAVLWKALLKLSKICFIVYMLSISNKWRWCSIWDLWEAHMLKIVIWHSIKPSFQLIL